ncbi:oxidoreductase (plasmid) [Rhizobium grahamii CCGE 502]|uniref:Oxidoreductase n=1 Tax=Rhizobium grahamii CCGE 502 TaxID=990285 RepID=S3H799_9HYPH|nr:oxidoreductase [Rhizobium grahamii CCGE 502]
MSGQKTILITGASQGIGAGPVKAFLDKGWNVVGTSRRISNTTPFDRTARLELVDGDVGDPATAERVAHRAVDRFGSIDALVNDAGIEGFIYFTKQAIRQMLLQNSGGSVVTITSSLTDHPPRHRRREASG